MKNLTRKALGSLAGMVLCLSSVSFGGTHSEIKNNGSTLTACPTITVTITKSTNVTCYGDNNGMAIATAAGGTSPYTYSWAPSGGTSDTGKNLSAGTYTVTATDFNGCTGTTTVTITQPAMFHDSISRFTPPTCYGGTGSLRDGVKGGTGPYTYAWKPSGGTGRTSTAISAGTYTVVVTDANGCKDSTIGVLTQPAQIKDSTVIVNVACKGSKTGSITSVVTTGGTSPYTYAWSSGQTTSSISGLAAGSYTLTVTDRNFCTQSYTLTVTQPATALTATATGVDATCGQSNGEAYATVSGGNSPYDFTWAPSGGTNDTAKGLAAAGYTVTVTDSNGCTITAATTVNNNSTLAVTGSSTNVTPCYGGSNGTATANATGGTPAYTYSWSTGATTSTINSLAAGIYTITVTDSKGCITSTTDTVKQPALSKDSITKFTNITCNGSTNGAVTDSAYGGTAPYTYAWSNGATTSSLTNLTAGTYTVTSKDANGCTANKSVTVTQPSAIRDSVVTQTNVSCFGNTNGRVTIGVSGGTPGYTYSWAPGGSTRNRVTGGAGTYTVTITDSKGCTKIDSVTITQPPALVAKITDSTLVMCNGSKTGMAVVTVTGGTPTYTYAWAASGGTKDTASNLGAGIYTVTVRDANGCNTTATVNITQPATAVTATSKVYSASCGKSNGSAVVTATGGTPGYTYNWTPAGGTADSASGLGAGIYTCTVTDANGCSFAATATVTDSSTLAATLAYSTNVAPCFGDANGTAKFNVTGGTAPYTYSWAPYGGTKDSAQGLAGNTYTFTVTDSKGCIVTSTVTITRPTLLVGTVTSITNETCNGGTNGRINVTASGGTPGYTYSWSNGATTSNITGLAAGTYTITITDSKGCTAIDSATVTQPTAITDSVSFTDILCNGANSGTASVTVSGGTPTYRYTWAPGGNTTSAVTNLTAGTYTVTIRDANFCTATANVTITQPSAIRDSIITSTNIMCFGSNSGNATVGVKGGTPGYTYSWTPSGGNAAMANNLTAGSYTCTVTDSNGCTSMVNTTITQPATAVADSATTIAASCGKTNGSATVFAYNGTPGYTYSWSSGQTTSAITSVVAGSYTCTVTDANGCSIPSVVLIADSSTLAATITSYINVTCNGLCNGSATGSASGGTAPYSYSWNNGSTAPSAGVAICAGKYTFSVTDSKGCIASDTVTISQPAPLIVVMDSSIGTGCNNSAWAVVSGGTPPYSYSWTSGQTTDTATSLCNGSYTVTVTDANSCTTTGTITVLAPTGIANIQNTNSFTLYPVPATGLLNISISGNFAPDEVLIYDMTGRKLLEQKVSPNTNIITIDVSKLDQGAYILKVVSGESQKLARFTVIK
jgi:hypothetical protein